MLRARFADGSELGAISATRDRQDVAWPMHLNLGKSCATLVCVFERARFSYEPQRQERVCRIHTC